jgi:hypothetical protein
VEVHLGSRRDKLRQLLASRHSLPLDLANRLLASHRNQLTKEARLVSLHSLLGKLVPLDSRHN